MTGEELGDARHDIGRAVIGRAFTHAEMAKLCGLTGFRLRSDRSNHPDAGTTLVNNGADTIRRAEKSPDGPTGPVASNVEWMLNVLDRDASREVRDAFCAAIKRRLFAAE